MLQDGTTRGRERERLLALNGRVTGITAFLVAPLVVANLAFQAFLVPTWQFFALTGAMVITTLLWTVSYVLNARGRLDASAGFLMYAALAFDAAAMVLRQDTLSTAALGDLSLIIYCFVFAPKLATGGAMVAVGSISALHVLAYLGLLPAAEPTPYLALLLDLSISLTAIPVCVYFLRERARLSELPYNALGETAREQQRLLDAVTRMQPEIDQLVQRGDETSRALAAQAQQQAATAEEVNRSLEAFSSLLADAVTASSASRTAADSTREESAQGLSQLVAASEQLDRFRRISDETQASMRQLAEQSQRTEEVIAFIREIDEQLHVLTINAALEAARAGEAGRGFMVVANELRSMLRQSSESLAGGRKLLGDIRKEAARTLSRAETGSVHLRDHLKSLHLARDTIERISSSFVETSNKVGRLADAADQQRSQIERISQAMIELQQSAGGLTDSARTLSDSMDRLSREQQLLRELLARHSPAVEPERRRVA
jgi:methyl-accepting chemotaxis protein